MWFIAHEDLSDVVVLCNDGDNNYMVGSVISEYQFVPNIDLPHRRKVRWFAKIARKDMSQELQNATGVATRTEIKQNINELEELIEKGNFYNNPLEQRVERFIDQRFDDYVNYQKSPEWNEWYKWEISRKLYTITQQNKKITIDNAPEILKEYIKTNPNDGSFLHRTVISDLAELVKHPEDVSNFLNSMRDEKYEEANESYKKHSFRNNKGEPRNIGVPVIGYIMAGFDPVKYTVYRYDLYQSFCYEIAERYEDRDNTASNKYNFYIELLQKVANSLIPRLKQAGYSDDFTNLPLVCAQDILYFLYTRYDKELIRQRLFKFIYQADMKIYDRNTFKFNIGDIHTEAWFNKPDGELNVPYFIFGDKATAERPYNNVGKTKIGFLYFRKLDKLFLVRRWGEVGDKIITDNPWKGYYIHKEFDPHHIPRSVNDDLQYLFDNIHKGKDREELAMVSEQEAYKYPKNLILYGPPGTGKTWNAINTYAKNLLEYQANREVSAGEVLAESLVSLTWWQVITLALGKIDRPVKVGELAEDHIIRSYARFVKSRTGNINPTLWGTLQERADEASSNLAARIEGVDLFTKNDSSEWSLATEGQSYFQEMLSSINTDVEGRSSSDWRKYYRTVTFHQSYSYEDFVEGIRPSLDEGSELRYEIKDGVFKQIVNEAKTDPDNNYLLIIDEINRGNISKIFGELITLLEEDKCGDDNYRVILPYSRELFTVPKNLYIIGTMNTADRSIALLDTALRRRFEFEELMPKYDIPEINREVNGINLSKLLKTLNQRICVLIGRDYQIGHSYFMKINSAKDLHKVWYGNIVPLVQEYFYNNWDNIKALLGNNFIHEQKVEFARYADIDIDDQSIYSFNEFDAKELINQLNNIVNPNQNSDETSTT